MLKCRAGTQRDRATGGGKHPNLSLRIHLIPRVHFQEESWAEEVNEKLDEWSCFHKPSLLRNKSFIKVL